MSRFKRIKNKTTKKSSVLIDEKIATLNKELGKTGMLEEESPTNSTDGVYSTSTYVPPLPPEEADVPNSSGVGDEGFSQSSAGTGVEGDAPSYSSLDDLYNGDAERPIFQTPTGDGLPASFGVVKYSGFGAGDNFGIVEGGNIVKLVLGGFTAGGTRSAQHYVDIYVSYQHANIDNPGTYTPEQIESARIHASQARQVDSIRTKAAEKGLEFNIPWQGYRSPQLFESLDGRITFTHDSKGLLVLSGFSLLGLPNRYLAQDARPPGSKDPIRRGLEDEPRYPGPIPPGLWPPLSPGAFNALREKAERKRKEEERRREEEERRRREEEERRREEEEEDDDGPLVHGMTQEEVERRYGNYDDDQLGRLHIKRLPDGSYREMTQAEINAFNKYYGNKVLGDLAEKVGISYSLVKRVFDTVNPLGKTIDNILKGDSGYDKLDKLLDPVAAAFGKGIASRAFKGKFKTPANVMFRYDKWLAGGAKGRVDVTNEISTKDMNNLKKELLTPGGFTADRWVKYYMKKSPSNPNPSKTREEALSRVADDVQGRIKGVMTREGTGLSMTFHNNVQLDKAKYIASGGKIVEMTKTYKFAEKTGSVKGFSKSVLGRLLSGMGVELDRFGTGGLHNSIISLLGAKYGLRAVNRQYGGKADSAPGMPMKIRISSGVSESVGSFDAYMNSTNLLTEGVGLGLYEPEAMNVDLADIRKGVMPEYPKKPPAEMIDGYHQDSKLKPKEFKDKYLLKIDEKDLLRNHRLKKGEADEMMNTIKMINDHLKDHPEDLIYAQQRYPIDDPRLAELNWKMDQMLEAGEEYLDSNFKENQTLYKRATDRTKKNIKLTDPEYVQKHYDELRGTTKPKKTKLVGRLGKHLNKYESKSFFKHVNSKDFKKISERKLEKEKFLEKQEQERLDYINDINAEMDEFRSDWRNELKEQPAFKAVPIDTAKMTSSQSFAIFPNFPGSSDTGIRLDLDGGLGRDNSLASTDLGLGDPNFTGIFQFPSEGGGFVPAISFKAGGEINSAQISYGDFPLSGYAMPLGGEMYRSITQRKKEDINKELDSSEEYTKQIKADALMKARVGDGPAVVKIYKASDFTPGEGLANTYSPEQLQKLSVENPQKFSEYKHISDIADEMTKKVETSFEKIDQEYSNQWEPKLSSLLPSNQYSDLYKKHGGSAFNEVNIEINRLNYEEHKAMTRVKTKDGIKLRSNKKSNAIRATANKISDAIPILQELQNKLDDIRWSKMDVVEAENRREMKALQKAAPEFFFPHGELKPLDLYMEPFGADLKTMNDIEKYAPEPTTKSMTGNEVNNLDNKQINTAVKDVGSSFGPNIGTGFKIFGDFLTKGYNDRFVADRKYLGKEYMNRQFFPNVSFDRDGTYVKKDVVVGSGQPAKYNDSTGMIEIRATFDFKTNAQEVAGAIASEKGEKADWASRFNRTGSKYALDAIVDPLPGVLKPLSGMVASHLISTAKFVGKGNLIPIVIKITPEELKLKNKKAYKQLVELGVIPKDK